MAEKTWMQRCGLTPVKGGAIALLLIALLVIVGGQLLDTDPPAQAVSGAAAKPSGRSVRQSAARPQKAAVAAQVTPQPAPLREWPRFPVEQVIQFDPLRLPDRLAAAGPETMQAERNQLADERQEQIAAEERRRTLRQTLQEEGVRMIVVGPHGKSAYLGTRLIREGDVIDGFIVKDIGPNGVELVEPQTQ